MMHAPRVLALIVVFALAALQSVASAQSAIFKGEFRLSDIDVVGDDVMFVVTVRVTNISDDVALDARITLERPGDADSPGDAITTFARTTFVGGDTARLEQSAHVSYDEYRSWLDGQRPRFSIAFYRESGELTYAALDLTETSELPGGLR